MKQEILLLQYYLEHLELRTCTTVLVRRSLPKEREREREREREKKMNDFKVHALTVSLTAQYYIDL